MMYTNPNMPNQKQVKLAQAYIPYQTYANLFPVTEALFRGTIFQDLYQPYVKQGKRKS